MEPNHLTEKSKNDKTQDCIGNSRILRSLTDDFVVNGIFNFPQARKTKLNLMHHCTFLFSGSA